MGPAEGWVAASLDEVCEVNPRRSFPEGLPRDTAVSFVPMAAVDAVTGTIAAPEERLLSEVVKGYTAFRDGDVIIAKITPCFENGKAAVASGLASGLGFGSTEFHVLRPKGAVLPEYVFQYVRQQRFRETAADEMTGTVGQKRLPADYLRELIVPIAPLSEQRRIVRAVQALVARVDAARERLAKVQAILKRFRQAVLAAAYSGTLTDDWRARYSEGLNADALLEKISKERANAHGQRGNRDGSQRVGVPPVIWDVPATWAWASIHSLLAYDRPAAYGVLQPGSDVANGIPFVRVSDLKDGTVNTAEIKRISPAIDQQYPRTRLRGGEVLVSLVGTIGRTAVAPQSLVGANVARAIGMFPLCPHVVPRYLQLALDHPAKKNELVELAREVARKTLNLGLLKAVEVPVAPFPEQVEVVRRVEALFKLTNVIERRVAATMAKSEQLTKTILAKAFRGELVPTEAELARRERRDYEPASVLLERIRRGKAEEEGAATGPMRRRGARRSA